MAGSPGGEKLWGQQQFGFAEHGALNSLANLVNVGGVVGGPDKRDAGLKRALQTVIAHVADEQCPAGCQQSHRDRQHVGEIARAREVLDHRVEHHHIEMALRQRICHIGGLHPQPHPIPPRLPGHGGLQPLDRRRGEVRGPVLGTDRRQLGKQ